MKKPLQLPVFVVLLMLFWIAGCSSSEEKPDVSESEMNAVFKEFDRKDGPGCAVAVVKDGKVIFEKGYGMANLEYDIPVTPATIFDIASVSKQFAGFAVSKLVEEKKISLDDDVRKYLPDVPDFGKKITIRHLVHHTSGLRDWPEALNIAGWRWDEVFSFNDIMNMVRAQKDLDFDPGNHYSYSNTGYNLLAAIVEKVSGQSFRTWTEANIFKPLNMNSSEFQDDYTRLIKNMAYSYSARDKEFVKTPGALTAYGSSSLFTSVEDLSKWVIHFDKEVAAKNPVYLRMLEEGKLNNGETVHYGYGLATGQDRTLKTISHTGGWAGYRTIIRNYPNEKISVIILSNSSDFNPDAYASQVADQFLGKKLKSEGGHADHVKDLATIKLEPGAASKLLGTYQLGPGWAATFTWENSELMVQATGEPKFPVEAKSDSVVWVPAYGASATFVKDADGSFSSLKYRDIIARRITPWSPKASQLSQYAGTYYSEELGTEYKVKLKGDTLAMHHMRNGNIMLTPDATGQDQFASSIGNILFMKDAQQKISGLTVSGGRVKNLKFRKK
ncbi:serine hydrolase domain-containing protein [Dyadobacter bucti]|uniref:serine hydrolase domain-containing protein n=1 Tax=Dyadobacter bucti TaxID=2572203 RepID=UPI001109AD96|nr:serine hydrolase domain-containing protein [Dyadobacter bucti]